jgi:hypothetical protein
LRRWSPIRRIDIPLVFIYFSLVQPTTYQGLFWFFDKEKFYIWTRVLAATVAGGIAFFALGFVIYGVILDPLVMRPNMNPDAIKLVNVPPVWILVVLSYFVSAFLLAYIFEKWASIKTFMGGLQGGAVVWFLTSLGFQLTLTAFMKIATNYIPGIADVAGSTVMGALGGGVIGQVLGMMNKAD